MIYPYFSTFIISIRQEERICTTVTYLCHIRRYGLTRPVFYCRIVAMKNGPEKTRNGRADSAADGLKSARRAAFAQGFRDGIPIGLGYVAVAFSLGITARNAGLTALQGALASFLCVASAGEYAGFTLIAASAALAEVALMSLIVNLRYMLMSLALTQRTDPNMPFFHRLIFGGAVTDEIFAINIARPGFLDPFYFYGAMVISVPLWTVGTALGIIAGDVLPARVVSALSVALYGMFIAIIVPQARKSKVIAGIIVICFAASWGAEKLPFLQGISSGTRTIILTVVIASAAALLFPVGPSAAHGNAESAASDPDAVSDPAAVSDAGEKQKEVRDA